MSKSSIASAPKYPTPLRAKSAWSRGPPQSSSTAPSPRSQSPTPSTPVLQSHSRRPSAIGQGIPIKDGVIIPRNNLGAVKQGSAVTFGSIDDVSAPISSSPAAVPPTKSEGVKTFGSVPVATATGHVNGKPSISPRASVVPPTASTSSAASSSALSAATPPAKPKIDIKAMFKNPSSAPSSNPPSDSSSPSMRNAGLPTQQQQPHQGQSSHTYSNASQLAHQYTPFVPSNNMRPPQSNGPNGGPPRSLQYPLQMSNGDGPLSQGGQDGGPPAGLSSPRLASHPHNLQSSTMPPPPPPQIQPQMQPQMQHMWYNQYPPSDQPHFMPHYQQWYNPMQMPPQHQPPKHQPHPGSQMPHPMPPRNPPSPIQVPSMPTLSHTIASPVHPPPHLSALAHSSNSLGLTSPPSTPSIPSMSANRLDVGSRAFKLTIDKTDETEVLFENLTKSTPTPLRTAVPSLPKMVLRQGIPRTPNRRPTSIRMETKDQHKSRLAEQEQNDKLKAEAADKEKKEKEKAEAERYSKIVMEEIRNLEMAKEQKELRRKEEEERFRKEAEALELQRLKKRRLKLQQERAKEKERKEEEEREAQERLSKLAEEARLRLEEGEEGELEAHKGYGKQDGQLEDGKDVDTETFKSMEDGKDKPSKDSFRIVEKPMTIHLAEDCATSSRNRAIILLQEQEDGLTMDQKIAMILCFMEDVVAANTYILLTDPGVRQGWILMMLKKRRM